MASMLTLWAPISVRRELCVQISVFWCAGVVFEVKSYTMDLVCVCVCVRACVRVGVSLVGIRLQKKYLFYSINSRQTEIIPIL